MKLRISSWQQQSVRALSSAQHFRHGRLDSPAAEVDGPKVTWQVSLWGKRRALSEGIEKMAEYVGEKTDGNFKIDIRYGGLAGPTENLEGVEADAFASALICTSFATGKLPALSGLELPFLPVDSIDQRKQVFETYLKHPAVVAELEKWNAVPLFAAVLPNYAAMGRGEAPKKLNDFEGMRMNSTGQVAEAMKLLGASVSSVTPPELYQSMERGVMDAVVYPFSSTFFAYRINELSDWYTTNFHPGTGVCLMIANKGEYEGLPDQYKKLLQDGKDGAYQAMIDQYKADDAKNVPVLEKDGVEAVTFDEETLKAFQDKAAKPIWEAWVKARDAQGLPGQDLLDTILKAANDTKQ
ncbi:MAG: TRAP transporter substrate-binding protein DctP [Rhodobiaceae bacterium]|nr:TRAP transporter substrate-binding protein DctP [Rhodobiaceae bacterium]